jgi:hypothetical protein
LLTALTWACTAPVRVPPQQGDAPALLSLPHPGTGSLIAQRLPRVAYRGGSFLRNPRLVTITFQGDDPALVARLEHFADTITRSPWWQTVVEGYCTPSGDCIGTGQPGIHVQLDALPGTTIHAVDIAALLAREAQAGRLGVIDQNTLLLVYLPLGVTLTDAFVPRYCAGGPRALHRALSLGEKRVAYAVLPRCSDEAALTASASHEILEATTNPDPARRGFAFEQSSATLGFTASGVEPVDPCGLIMMDQHWIQASGFTVQRAWSNRAVAQGQDPCVPAPSTSPYVALVPEQPTVRLRKVGDSVTLTLRAVSDRTVSSWAVSAIDLWGLRDHQHYVEVTLDHASVTAGETVTLTITARKQHPQELCLVGLVSKLDEASYIWPLAVVMR